jgi:type IV pilus assembly protein PilC
MTLLAYSVRDQKGNLIRGESDARTKEELIRSLQAKGLIVISVEEKREVVSRQKMRKKLHKKVRMDDLIIFARQLAVLLESGVPILKAMHVLSQQVGSKALFGACKKIEEDLRAGITLRDALAKHPKIFSQMWIDLIETGEATGQLSYVLKRLAEYFEEVWTLRKKVVSALIYPAVLISVAILAVFIFMYKVIPVFAGIYKGFGRLPALTAGVIAVSDFIARNIITMIIFFVVCGFLLRRFIRTDNGRKWFDGLKLRIPVLGDLFLSVAIERFATALGMMLKGGISIIHALEVAIKSTANKVIEDALEKVRLNVMQGKNLSQPMMDIGIFPPMVTQMISVGEESGKLSQLLDEVSKFYAEDISTKITRLVALFEPIILVVMGVVIGILVIAMYLPIFSIATTSGTG